MLRVDDGDDGTVQRLSTEPAFASIVHVIELWWGGNARDSSNRQVRSEERAGIRAGGVMRKLVYLGIALGLAACADSPTAPAAARRITPASATKPGMDITCRSGYIVAYRSDGTQYCAPDGTQQTMSMGSTSTSTDSKP
jgi:hypothetical protein